MKQFRSFFRVSLKKLLRTISPRSISVVSVTQTNTARTSLIFVVVLTRKGNDLGSVDISDLCAALSQIDALNEVNTLLLKSQYIFCLPLYINEYIVHSENEMGREGMDALCQMLTDEGAPSITSLSVAGSSLLLDSRCCR